MLWTFTEWAICYEVALMVVASCLCAHRRRVAASLRLVAFSLAATVGLVGAFVAYKGTFTVPQRTVLRANAWLHAVPSFLATIGLAWCPHAFRDARSDVTAAALILLGALYLCTPVRHARGTHKVRLVYGLMNPVAWVVGTFAVMTAVVAVVHVRRPRVRFASSVSVSASEDGNCNDVRKE